MYVVHLVLVFDSILAPSDDHRGGGESHSGRRLRLPGNEGALSTDYFAAMGGSIKYARRIIRKTRNVTIRTFPVETTFSVAKTIIVDSTMLLPLLLIRHVLCIEKWQCIDTTNVLLQLLNTTATATRYHCYYYRLYFYYVRVLVLLQYSATTINTTTTTNDV